MKDNLYYGFEFELEIDQSRVARTYTGGRSSEGSEVLVPSDAILIRRIYIFYNLHVSQGSARNTYWPGDPQLHDLELIPSEMAAKWADVEAHFVRKRQ